MIESAVIQVHRREAFEANVCRALLAGVVAGLVELLVERVFAGAGRWPAGTTGLLLLAHLSIVAATVACIRGDRLDQILLWFLGATLPSLPWILGMSSHWALGTGAATAGALMVRAHLCDRGEGRQLADRRPGTANYFLSAALCAFFALAGVEIAHVLGMRLAQFDAPRVLVVLLSGMIIAFFAALSSIGAHLALRPDPVEARCEQVLALASGELRAMLARALDLYRQCGRSLALLPLQAAREDLAKTLAAATRDTAELAHDWAGVEAQLDEGAERELASEASDLGARALSSSDPIVRRQLSSASQSLREETARMGELKLRRERGMARIRSQLALLQRARIALIALRTGQAQIKAAELEGLSRRLIALSALQSDEGLTADEVANSVLAAGADPTAQADDSQLPPALSCQG